MNTTSAAGLATRKTTPCWPIGRRTVASPTTLGLVKSFGFGDRFGLATPGHLAAAQKFDFAPIFAQQSIRELERTQRTPQQVVKAATTALAQRGYSGKWGADADHLKTTEHVDRMAAAGFCFFTIDPSEHVGKGTVKSELESAYLGRKFDVPNVGKLQFDAQSLRSAATKYGRALEHVGLMGRHIAKTMGARPFEIEVSVDETSEPTSVLDHLFIGLELRRLAVPRVISVAPRFIGDFEKGIDYKGDLQKFEASLREHLEIARFCGPYKISVHSGSDKFAIYPILGRVCGPVAPRENIRNQLPRRIARRGPHKPAGIRGDRRVLPRPVRDGSSELPHLDDAGARRGPAEIHRAQGRTPVSGRSGGPATVARDLWLGADASDVQAADPGNHWRTTPRCTKNWWSDT